MSEIDWNALGTWIGALATSAAAGIALWIAIRDGRERDRARRDDEAAQARTVTVKAEKGTASDDWHTAIVRIANHGTLPILAVQMERLVVQWVGDGPQWRHTVFNGRRPILPAGKSFDVAVNVKKPNGEQLSLDDSHLVSAVISYRDASGRKWTRWGNTDPQRILTASDTKREAPDQRHTVEQLED